MIFSSSTSFWAVNDIFPIFFPFLSPLKISKTSWTIFYQFDFHFWFADLNLGVWSGNPCFNFLPVTLFLHILNEDFFKFERINLITSFSLRLNWKSIASKDVLSSHAISMIRSISNGFKSFCMIFFNQIKLILLEICEYLGTYIPMIFYLTYKTLFQLICFGYKKWIICSRTQV